MDVFAEHTLWNSKSRFTRPSFETVHRIEVLFPNGTCWVFDGEDLTPNYEDALVYTDMDEAAEDYERLCLQGLDASIETFQRIAR